MPVVVGPSFSPVNTVNTVQTTTTQVSQTNTNGQPKIAQNPNSLQNFNFIISSVPQNQMNTNNNGNSQETPQPQIEVQNDFVPQQNTAISTVTNTESVTVDNQNPLNNQDQNINGIVYFLFVFCIYFYFKDI